jgi:valyl-tRNA synthetase
MEKKYNHLEQEKLAQEKWNKEQTYSVDNNSGELYSIDTPPPTVSGALHIGHIFSYTQTDVIARYKRMSGYNVFYPFGFDDNGLPTERFVEKKLDITAYNLKRSEFIALCLQETEKAEHEFKNLWQRMGLSADWNRTYSTISDSTRKISQESFIRLYKKGFIYRKNEPALYCPHCFTSVAQAELDDSEKASTFNDITFELVGGGSIVIGTTRPELLPSCVAIFYHPNDPRYTHLQGKFARVPLFNQEVPLLPDEMVQIDKGTGLVMCCTFGDKTDIHWYKTHNLPYRPSIGRDGKWLPHTGILAGLRTVKARETVLEELKKQNLLVSQKPVMHTVNVHERCKKEIEYLALPQWFIKILEHKKTLVEQADAISWYPEFMKSRYKNWVENLGWDWGISRQRFFGIPFPAWHCQDCNEILLADIATLPIDPQESAYPGKTCTKCSSSNIIPDTDVMDTWNTSSLTPYLCSALYNNTNEVFDNSSIQQFLPMSMRPQAHDIIRTWAFYTITKTWMHDNVIPWKNIVISGHVVSDAKEKLSKSKENNKLAPETLLEMYPADAIRYWTARASLGHDTAFSDTQLKLGVRLITKMWNAYIFISEHIANVNPENKPKNLGTVNEWILHQASRCFESYNSYFAKHEFGLALDAVDSFFWADVCDNYLELVKHQLFNPHEYKAEDVYATQWTLYTIGMKILQLYAPYVSHITETIYTEIYQKSVHIHSVHQTKFASIQTDSHYPASAEIMQSVIAVITEVRKLKSEHQLSLKTELESLTICAPEDVISKIKTSESLIKGVSQAKAIIFTTEKQERALLQKDSIWYAQVTL